MITIAWSAAALGVVLVLAFTVLLRRVVAAPHREEEDIAPWLEKFSTSRYRPMERLLTEDDYEFLAAQPGYDPSIGRALKRARRRVFRSYLSQLSQDFSRLHRVARLLVTYSPEDRPELARKLVSQRWVFECAMLKVRWNLLLHTAGLSTVDVSGLLRVVDGLNVQIRQPAMETSNG